MLKKLWILVSLAAQADASPARRFLSDDTVLCEGERTRDFCNCHTDCELKPPDEDAKFCACPDGVQAGSEVEILILNTGFTTAGGVPTVVGGGFAEAAFSGQYGPLAKIQEVGMAPIVAKFLEGTLELTIS